ncbi:LuxR family transcriptional regulator [Azotobacter chroococcum]|uniref:response regulator transcription factor n=1 Tax=Azotobacter chroococcum TaxID=353 RepID=UPI00103C350F|nr:helix-turn-helix transcriptional regulator [Azotobacter chroococcum]TBW02154.1 LuxR family transcriptional regulator [Azotobacter chroococcum]
MALRHRLMHGADNDRQAVAPLIKGLANHAFVAASCEQVSTQGVGVQSAGFGSQQLQLMGQTLILMLVDGVMPMHVSTRGAKGVRLVYADNEVAHFEYAGHRYSLIEASPQRADNKKEEFMDIRSLLTRRELQVVQLVCMGCLTKQVADRLHISEFTVRSYLKSVYAKFGVRSRGAMVCSYMKSFGQDLKDLGNQ